MRANTLDFGMRNRIINGAMRIDQRNNGAANTPAAATVTYTLDRWAAYGSQASKFSVQQDSSANTVAGFTSSLKVTSLSAYSVGASEGFWVRQVIEGNNIADLSWGTANAKTVTLSFWVRSSLTGTFGGTLIDNYTPLSYPFSYTISAANTWEQKSITIAGPTSGTFPTGNTAGTYVQFSLGIGSSFSGTGGSWQAANLQSVTGATSVVGTNGATWYITGVQLEEGSTPTSFEYRQYGTELALCQRYFAKTSTQLYGSISGAAGQGAVTWFYKSTMRTAPTVTGNFAQTTVTSTADFAVGLTNDSGGYFASFASGSTASAEL
jgi:hypothetical protein